VLSRSVRRRRLLTLVAIALVAAFLASLLGRTSARTSRPPDPVRVVAGGQTVATIERGLLSPRGPAALARVRAVLARQIPAFEWVVLPHARVRYRNDRDATARLVVNAPRTTAAVQLLRAPVESAIAAPVLRQQLRNGCEAAALSILLGAGGRTVSQLRIQRLLPTSGPLDPRGVGARRVWGDPDLGFVGRPDGGGVAGGFGVYPRPIIRVARALGSRVDDLTGATPRTVYARLLAGRPVIAWVGLSAGPFGSWRSPAGRAITVNFGEHTVVLRGVNRDGSLSVSNPLRGTAETWTRAQFEDMWQLLGRRAVGA
jgi:uncharacterized protein YvpB